VAHRRPEFERFLGRVHRRYLLVRSAEVAGLGLLGGCAAGLPLTIILLWRGLPAVPLALASLGAGVLVGLIWAMIHRPTKLVSAMEADRQLDSADLLSSAVLVHRSGDPWSHAVVAEANQWCARHSPSAVLLNRLGVRAWGGIGLATGLLMILALLPVMPSPGATGQAGVQFVRSEATPTQSSRSRFSRRTPAQQEPEDLRPNRMAGAGEEGRQPQEGQGSGQRPGESTAGSGAGEAHSDARNLQGPKRPERAGGGAETSNTGRIAAGAGNTTPGAGSASNIPGGAAAAKSARGVPPWRSDHWPADIDRADQALRAGQIPDQYRDMIRGYFDRANAR
jgi:hypothetical protein